MSERKVLNKYYPADYDPSKIPKGKRNKNATFNIRIMAPFNMRCDMCKEYIYKGKKFNSRKEDVMDEDYLGLKIFRFYIKCPRCVSEIAFKTDLQNTDYTLEAGAKRLFEAEKIAYKMAEEERKAKEEEEMNPMTLLENRTKASRQEMDQIDTLEEIRELNTRKNQVNTDEMIGKYRKYEEALQQLQMEKEEEEINEIFGNKSGKVVKRLNDSDSDGDEPVKKKVATATEVTKATDILAEAPKAEEFKQKDQKVWQKSIGGLSSKQKLKGLVAVKKKSTLPLVSSTVTTASLNKTEPTCSTSSAPETVLSNGALPSSETNGKLEQNNAASGATSASGKATEGVENGDNDTSASNKIGDDVKNAAVAAASSKPTVTSATSKPIGLGLLGAYSDSDSDMSDT